MFTAFYSIIKKCFFNSLQSRLRIFGPVRGFQDFFHARERAQIGLLLASALQLFAHLNQLLLRHDNIARLWLATVSPVVHGQVLGSLFLVAAVAANHHVRESASSAMRTRFHVRFLSVRLPNVQLTLATQPADGVA
jgi:hypothetical protein